MPTVQTLLAALAAFFSLLNIYFTNTIYALREFKSLQAVGLAMASGGVGHSAGRGR
jgi:hypothetical protein